MDRLTAARAVWFRVTGKFPQQLIQHRRMPFHSQLRAYEAGKVIKYLGKKRFKDERLFWNMGEFLDCRRNALPPGAVAKREWKRLVKMLLRLRVLTEADGLALGNLCQAWSTLVKAQIKMNETGLLLKTPSGYVQQSPLLGIVNSCTYNA